MNNKFTKEDIIGLGEDSFRKNYYAELQQKIIDLEHNNIRINALIATMPDVLLVSTLDGIISPLENTSRNPLSSLSSGILENEQLMQQIKEKIAEVSQSREMATYNFSFTFSRKKYYLEARFHISEINEILIIIRDMTERTLLENKLREAAEKDALTSLYNRRSFECQLDAYHNKEYTNLSLLSIDIDGLKLINDTLGHPFGDSVIISVSRLINSFFQNLGFIARVGGDEFGVIINGLTSSQIEEKLTEFKESIKRFNESSPDKIVLSLSSGYSFHSSGIVNVKLMYQEADNNMYQNKLLKESSTHNSLVKALLKTLEAKDYLTEGHAERMEHLCVQMGKALKLSQYQMERLKLLSKFHDIGKVGIPDNILKKPSNLTESELNIMKTHSDIGRRIAETTPEFKDIALLIYHHHEKWDGTGYPSGIQGTEIPIECRILSIVDTYDAMTNDRPYRKALSMLQSVHEIYRCSGKQFDESLVKVFVKALSAKG